MAGRRRLPSQASGSPRAASGWELEAPAAARQRALLSWPRPLALSSSLVGFHKVRAWRKVLDAVQSSRSGRRDAPNVCFLGQVLRSGPTTLNARPPLAVTTHYTGPLY